MRKRYNFLAILAAVVFLFSEAAFAEPAEKTLTRVPEYEWVPVKVVKKIRLPGGYHEGLYYDGKDIWVNNGKNGSTWVVDTDTGKVRSHIKSISTFTEAITSGADATYYVTDWDSMKLYRAELSGDKFNVLKEMSFEPSHPAGVVCTGEKLYVITWTRGMGTKFHLLELDKDGHLQSIILIKCIVEPSQIAWDGKNLWITSWYSKLVYKIDIDTWKAVGLFTSPVSDATGIVWDGSYMWITGTHGDLYKLKVGSR
jgi:glutamine cyclotransferase